MALLATTSIPNALWTSFKKANTDNSIRTWEFHSDGVHFTHTSDQWTKKAWFKASVHEGMLTFNIVKPKGQTITTDVYAEYHGLLARVLLAHFDKQFSSILITALAASGDLIAETA
jgi:hypothetical protein